ncbi:MAG TPA: hypothetical protein VG917_01935 [Patescibacteria group bacterium]|nr:hypothetical protein [Patescibacteria group bacterium]
MSLKSFLFLAIFIALFFESSLISLPLVFILCLLLYIIYPDTSVVIFALFMCMILDVLRVGPIGLSSLAIIIAIGLVELIRSSMEFRDYKLIIPFLFIASYLYANLFVYSVNFLTYFVLFGVASLIVYYFSGSKLLWRKGM